MSEKIGKYTLEEEIGEGGYGICYKAKDENGKFYAIKKIKITKEKQEDMVNEINLLNMMKQSKYSVNFIESIPEEIPENGEVSIVMELCDGDLSDLLEKKNGNLDIVTIIKIMNQFNEALEFIHSNQLEHRDLKPENILIKYINENDFEIKLTDYGCSKEYEISNHLEQNPNDLDENSSNQIFSKFTDFLGSDYYRAPEIYKKEGNSKSDLWSIGLILYYLYFNQIPFTDREEYINFKLDVILKETDYRLLNDLLNKLLFKDYNERIGWDDYFDHPFNKQQIIEIVINSEEDDKNINIFDNENFKCAQLEAQPDDEKSKKEMKSENINNEDDKSNPPEDNSIKQVQNEELSDSENPNDYVDYNPIMFVDRIEGKFNNNLNLKKGKHKIIIVFYNDLTDCKKMFNKCKNIIEIKFFNLRTDKVTDRSYMFSGCSNLKYLDLRCFKTENVTNMSGMFNECSNLKKIDVSSFNTENVTDMSYMFNECSNLINLDININNFKTKQVKNKKDMFNKCSKLKNLDINNF
jgi:surface protein